MKLYIVNYFLVSTSYYYLDSRMTSVEIQVQMEELNRTVAISCISVPTRPLPSVWCKWIDGRICIATQTPTKCARSKWKRGRKPKGSPPSVDPYTGLEISKYRDCSNDDTIEIQCHYY